MVDGLIKQFDPVVVLHELEIPEEPAVHSDAVIDLRFVIDIGIDGVDIAATAVKVVPVIHRRDDLAAVIFVVAVLRIIVIQQVPLLEMDVADDQLVNGAVGVGRFDLSRGFRHLLCRGAGNDQQGDDPDN